MKGSQAVEGPAASKTLARAIMGRPLDVDSDDGGESSSWGSLDVDDDDELDDDDDDDDGEKQISENHERHRSRSHNNETQLRVQRSILEFLKEHLDTLTVVNR